MSALPSDTFARRFRAERERQGVSQAEIARRMAQALGSGIDQSAVTRIEQRTRAVRLDEAAVMAEALRVPLIALMSDDAAEQNARQIREAMIELADAQRRWRETGEEVVRLTQRIQELRASEQVSRPD